MPASMTMAFVASRPNVAGSRRLIPASGPTPGRTPTRVPITQPTNAEKATAAIRPLRSTTFTRKSSASSMVNRYPSRSSANVANAQTPRITTAWRASPQPTSARRGARAPRAMIATPKATSTRASATGTKAGPGVRRVPSGRPRLSTITSTPSRARAPPATRSVVSISSVRGATAGEIVDGTRAERALVRGQPGHQRGDFFRLSHASHGDLGNQQVHRALLHLLEHLGADHGGRHGIDEDPARGHFLGQRLGEPDDAGLGRGIGHEGGIALLARDGGDINDAASPLPQHDLDGRAAAEEDAGEVHGDHAGPVLVAELPDREGAPGDPRIIDQDVEPSPGLGDALHGGVHLGGSSHVGGDGDGAAAHLLRGGLGGLGLDVEHRDASAVGAEPAGDGQADAAGGAGDESRFPGEGHGSSFRSAVSRPAGRRW